jgi:hypothetical protein
VATNQTIKLKRGTTTPTTSNISSGEVAIDTSAQKFYVNDAGTIKEVGPGAAGDFVVDTNLLFVDVSADRIGMGTATPGDARLHIVRDSTEDTLTLESTEDTSVAAPVICLKRNSSTPADGDYLGQLKFLGENDADQQVVYAKITAKTSDVTDTTEDGLLEFMCRKGGSNNINARLTHSDLKLINGTGLEVAGSITASSTVTITDDLAVDTDTLFVDVSTDRVGINTSSPAYELDVEGTTDPSIRVRSTGTASTDDASMSIQIGGTTATSFLYFGDSDDAAVGEIKYNHEWDYMSFRVNDSERMRIDNNGKVAIGTTSPSYALDVAGATDPSIRVASTGTANTDDAIMRIQIGGTSASSYIYFGDSADDNVGNLRYNHSTDELSVIIGAVEEFRFASGGTFHADADIVAYSTTVASDAALKYNINPVENALDKLNSLDGVTFQWKRDDKVSAGVIAQDVEKVMPSAVKEVESLRDNSTHKAVDYNQIIALLVEAVKDQQKQIDELRK